MLKKDLLLRGEFGKKRGHSRDTSSCRIKKVQRFTKKVSQMPANKKI